MPTWMRRIRARLLRRRADACLNRASALYRAGDPGGAAAMALQAARMEHAQAQSLLAGLLETGDGVPRDEGEAAKWYARAAALGHPPAMVALGRMYRSSAGVGRDLARSTYWLRRSAEAGYALGQSVMGLAHREGQGVPVDLVESARWFQLAAVQGEPTACQMLGIAYERGEGVEQDLAAAFLWQRRSAERGHAPGQFNLARLYADGIGIRADAEAATKWFLHAAEQGDADAQFAVARRHLRGEGTPVDAELAAQWMTKAAEQGHALAITYLGGMHADGLGVEKNLHQAMELLAKASSKGLDVDDAWRAVLHQRIEAMGARAATPPPEAAEQTARSDVGEGSEDDEANAGPDDAVRSDFRRQSCFYAFHLFPGWWYSEGAADPQNLESLQAASDRLWDEAGRLEAALGPVTPREPSRPICRQHDGERGRCWSIRMPLALKPPEPSVLIFDSDGHEPSLRLAEVCVWPFRGLAWCHVDRDGRHSVIDLLGQVKREAVVRSWVENGQVATSPMQLDLLSPLLMLYIETAHDFGLARSKLAGASPAAESASESGPD